MTQVKNIEVSLSQHKSLLQVETHRRQIFFIFLVVVVKAYMTVAHVCLLYYDV